MSNLVTSIDDIVKNVDTLYNYGQSDVVEERNFHDARIKNGKLFVAVQSETGYRFAPSKFAGYIENSIQHKDLSPQRDGRITNVAIKKLVLNALEPGDGGYEKIDQHFSDYCSQHNIEPSNHHRPRRYWLLEAVSAYSTQDENIDDDVYEGALKTIKVNRFERSAVAREACLKHYGYGCSVCEVRLEDVYGDLAKNFIHVHHIVPLSSIAKSYKVNAIKDLRPVCPNCHAMLHRRKEVISIDALKTLLGM